MEQRKLLVTMKDIQKYKILKDVIEKKLKGTQAAQILNLTPVHISRLKKRLLNEGFHGLLRKLPTHAPNKNIHDKDVGNIIKLRKKLSSSTHRVA